MGRGRRGGVGRRREGGKRIGKRRRNSRNCLGFSFFYEGQLNAFKVAAWQILQRFQFGCAINKVQSSEGQRGRYTHTHIQRENSCERNVRGPYSIIIQFTQRASS